MKNLPQSVVILIFIIICFSCKKTSFINSRDAVMSFSVDTVHFDTVFTTAGSITQYFKVFNQNNQKLRLSQIKLMGGLVSPYKINVDGTSGASFQDVELEPNDSVYIFVSVSVNPNSANLPFIVRDSILVNYNGNIKYIQLQAYGQNAHFYTNKKITADTTWNNELPFVILGGLTVDSNVTLKINKGCKIYSHANAAFIVNGTLKVDGEVYDSTRVTFSGDRLDQDYNNLPAAWPGIYFTSTSRNNVLTWATIKNAYQGVIAAGAGSNQQLTLNQCIIDNIYDAGILSIAGSIKATNCLITNCGNNISITAGGNYFFDHCTVVTYATIYNEHKNPVLAITNTYDQSQTFPLVARFQNCIFYGEGGLAANEVVIDKKATADVFDVNFQNVLYRNKDETVDEVFTNSIKNEAPQFDSIDAGSRFFNFHLKASSPAIDKGITSGASADLDGKSRGTLNLPDLGCYEY